MKTRLYISQNLQSQKQLVLNKPQTHFLKNVLRLTMGDQIGFFNNQDGEWLGEIAHMTKSETTISLIKQTKPFEPVFDIELIFSPIKKTHTDFLIQQATEIGVRSFTPILCDRTITRRINVERLTQNAIEAAELSERVDIPAFNPLQKLEDWLQTLESDRHYFFCDEAKEDQLITNQLALLKKQPMLNSKWGIIIGPEGGFSDHERQNIKKQKACIPVMLSPRVMRADTASTYCISILQSFLLMNK